MGQKLRVLDKTNLRAIENVVIENKNGISLKTNSNGVVDLTTFNKTEELWLVHPDYQIQVYSHDQLAALNFVIYLLENSYSLNEVVVSANKFNEKLTSVGQLIHVVNAKELAFLNQQTTPDMLQSTGSVFVQKSQMGGGSPVIRGFETNKVLMVVDGVRMNNAIYRGGHLQNSITLDNSMLDRVEIILGPGSVVYGSDALGGVMHFSSKKAKLSSNDTLQVRSNAFMRFSTANNEKTGHFDINFGLKKFASITSLTYADFGDLRQGDSRSDEYPNFGLRDFYVIREGDTDLEIENTSPNIQKQSGYRQYDFLQKFHFQQNEFLSHSLNLQYSISSDIPRYDRLTQVQNEAPKYAQWYYGPQKRLFSAYTLSLTKAYKLYDQAKIILGYQNIEESRNDRRFNTEFLNHRIEKLDIYTLNADFEKIINRHTLRYGLDFWYNDVSSSANKENILTGKSGPLDTRYPDGGSIMQSYAAYFTHSFALNDRWIINEGIRLNYVALSAQFDDKTFFPFYFDEVTQNNTALNGNISVIYNNGNNWRLMAVGSSGFRAPNVDDLSKVFESALGEVIVPNPNIGPEYTYNVEIGISKKLIDKIHVGVNAYYTWYQNAITTQSGTFNGLDSILYNGELSRVLTNINANDAYLLGYSGYVNADLSNVFFITNSINYTYGRLNSANGDYPLDHISPLFGRTSLNVQLNKFKGAFFVVYNGAKKSKDYNLLGEDNEAYSVDPINGYTPAWMTFNLNGAYQLNSKLQFQLGIENLLDKNYRPFASNISASGRNFSFTLRGSF